VKVVTAAEASERFEAILDEAQREPVLIRRQEQAVAVVLSIDDYERLRAGVVRAFLDARNEVANQAIAAGLTEERMTELLNGGSRSALGGPPRAS